MVEEVGGRGDGKWAVGGTGRGQGWEGEYETGLMEGRGVLRKV